MNTLTNRSSIFSVAHTLTKLSKQMGMEMQYQALFSFVLKDTYKLSKEETPVVLYNLVPEGMVKEIVASPNTVVEVQTEQDVMSTFTTEDLVFTKKVNTSFYDDDEDGEYYPFGRPEPMVIIKEVKEEIKEVVFSLEAQQEVAKEVITMLNNSHNCPGLSGHQEAAAIFRNFKSAVNLAKDCGLKEEAISYYNWIFLKGNKELFFTLGGSKGSMEAANYLIELSKGAKEKVVEISNTITVPTPVVVNVVENVKKDIVMDVSVLEQIKDKSAWGRKEILSLNYGNELSKEMIRMNKTNLSSKEIVNILFSIKAKECGFIYYNEFVELMKLQKTMINKETAQGLLRMFWENTKDEYKSNPNLFNIIKSIIIGINNSLTNNNSTLQMRTKFMELFLEATL